MVLTDRDVRLYEGTIPGCFPGEGWDFNGRFTVESERREDLPDLAMRVWRESIHPYDHSAILLAEVGERKAGNKTIYSGISYGCSQRLM